MKIDKSAMLLYAVTDRSWLGQASLKSQVEAAIRGGVTCVQLREKDLNDSDFLAEAMEIGALCRQAQIPFIVNDNVQVAVKSRADGVHIGQHDLDARDVRKTIGADMILGVSAQTVEQAVRAESDGADYLGVGAVFSTSTKLDADDVSWDTLRDICAAVSIPVVAIGGINGNNISRLSRSGVDGVAIVSAIFSAKDIEAECRYLLSLSRKMVFGT